MQKNESDSREPSVFMKLLRRAFIKCTQKLNHSTPLVYCTVPDTQSTVQCFCSIQATRVRMNLFLKAMEESRREGGQHLALKKCSSPRHYRLIHDACWLLKSPYGSVMYFNPAWCHSENFKTSVGVIHTKTNRRISSTI